MPSFCAASATVKPAESARPHNERRIYNGFDSGGHGTTLPQGTVFQNCKQSNADASRIAGSSPAMTFVEKGELGNVTPIALFIDADACPVKQEIYRVAERHALKGTALKVFVVTNSPIAVPRDFIIGGPTTPKFQGPFSRRPLIKRIIAGP